MAYKDSSIFTRFRSRRTQPAMTAAEPEWRENMRDLGLMLSGIYQDLRGDINDANLFMARSIKSAWRRLIGPRD